MWIGRIQDLGQQWECVTSWWLVMTCPVVPRLLKVNLRVGFPPIAASVGF